MSEGPDGLDGPDDVAGPGELDVGPQTAGGPSPEPTGDGSGTAPARSYEDAAARIEEIIRRLDSGETGLRETLDLVREGRELVEWCAAELDAVGRGLEELRLDELVARLEGGPGAGPSAG